MKIRTRSALGLLVSGLLVAVAACGGSSTGSSTSTSTQAQTNIRWAFPNAVALPNDSVAIYAVGVQEGFFAKEGIKVDTIFTNGVTAALQALAAGSVDIAGADPAGVMAAVEKGVPVKVISATVINNSWRIAVKPDSPIQNGSQLKGKKIGIISLTSGSYLFAQAFVSTAGLNSKTDVQYLPVGLGAAAAEAFNNGQVDALALYTTPYAQLQNLGLKFRFLDNPPSIVSGASWVTSNSYLKDQKDILARFLRATYESLLFSAANPQVAMKDGYQVFPLLLPAGKTVESQLPNDVNVLKAWLASVTPSTGTPATWGRWGDITNDTWNKTYAYAKSTGLAQGTASLSDLWDPELLDKANQFDRAAVLSKAKSES